MALLQACGGGGNQPDSTPPPTTDTTPPTVPADLAATAASSTRIDLHWTASTDSGGSNLAGYRLYRDGSTTALATINAPATTYADTGLAAHTPYSYVLRAFDGAGNESAASGTASAMTLAPSTPAVPGLDARPSNTSCRAWPKPANGTIQLERFTTLSFDSAIAMLQAPNDNDNWYVVEQGGTIQRFSGTTPASASPYGTLSVTSGGEMGLLGMAFHPGFPATDSRVFLSYTLRVGGQLVSRVSSFAHSTATALGPTETVLLTINQPEDNHNGGNIAFGPDGYLYIGFGDGGGGGDAHGSIGNGQRLTTLLGKMLRIDVNAGTPYGIPSSNPYAAQPLCPAAGRASGECPEIYAWGLRNPWRWSFDRETGALWVGDVGQGAWEEINRVNLGGNYGWRCREGAHDYNNSGSACATATLIDPVTEYAHSGADISITGGYVYRGTQSTALRGQYLFADYGSGIIRSWNPQDAPRSREPTTLLDTSLNIPSFAEGNDGELYVVAFDTLHHIIFQPPVGGGTVPSSLRATGCVSASDPKQPAPGLIPYDINAAFWSDNLDKQRWLALPDAQQINVLADGDWDFPNGTVLMKHFSVGTRLIETRLFMRDADAWAGYSYEWNTQQTDATLLPGGATRDIGNGQQWIFPSESQCMRCHTTAAGGALGPETAQMNRDFLYVQSGRTANQLYTLNHIQTLNPPIADPAAQPRLPDPADPAAPLAERARAYLHSNCSACHRPGGPTGSTMDLRYTTALDQTASCNVVPQNGDFGIGAAARLIAPGNAVNSVMVNRVNRRDAHAMPPLASLRVDAAGVALLTQWINGLGGCQ